MIKSAHTICCLLLLSQANIAQDQVCNDVTQPYDLEVHGSCDPVRCWGAIGVICFFEDDLEDTIAVGVAMEEV